MKLKPEHAKLAGYFNVDNGSGKIRGVYLQGNDAMRPVFEAWFKPFQDLGAGTISIRNTGGTDHQSFDAVGLPGFQFIQDGLEYNSRTHHSNMDVYDRVQRADMAQMAAIVASFVYNAANRDGNAAAEAAAEAAASTECTGRRSTALRELESVRFLRSSLLQGIKVRAPVRFHMPQISILRRLLFFIGDVDQDIEAAAVLIAINNFQPLLFMKL